MIKGSIQQEEIMIINVYAPSAKISNYVKQILVDLKGEVGSNTLIEEDLSSPLTSMGRLMRRKLSKETTELTQTLEQTDLVSVEPFISQAENTLFYFISMWNLLQNRAWCRLQNKH